LIRLNIISLSLISVFFGGNPVQAQSNVLDSLDNLYQKEESDSVRLLLLFGALGELGFDHIDTSFTLGRKIVEIATSIGDTSSIAWAEIRMSALHAAQGEFVEALRHDRKALAHMIRLDDKRGIAEAYNALGEDYLGMGLYNEAFIHYQRSIESSRSTNDSLLLTIAIYNLGRVFKAVDQLDRAREYINRSMDMSRKINDRVGMAYSLHDLGDIALKEGKFDEALKSLEIALEIAEQVEDNIIIPQIMDRIAELYFQAEEYGKALGYYDRSWSIYDRQSNENARARVSLGIGRIAMKQGKTALAKTYFDETYQVAMSRNSAQLLMHAHMELANWYEKKGNFRQALEFLRKGKALDDSLTLANRNEQFTQTQIQYELAQKDLAIDQLNQKEREQNIKLENEEFLRNILVVILAFTGILLITLYRNSVRSKRANELLLVHQQEIESKTRELQSLLSMKDKFFSIVSHDLRSPINALVGILNMLNDGHLTQEELIKLTKSLKVRLDSTGKMLGNLLDWAMMEMNEITMQREDLVLHDLVESNLQFFLSSNEKNIAFVNKVEKGVQVNVDRNMLDLIIRNLVSNSIKFTNEGGEVKVFDEPFDDSQITIGISDNGVGMPQDMVDNLFSTTTLLTTPGTANEKGRGLGLKLCKEFVEKMGGKIWVESEEGKGSTFKFTISNSDLS